MREKTIAYIQKLHGKKYSECQSEYGAAFSVMFVLYPEDRHDLVEYEEQDIGHDNHE